MKLDVTSVPGLEQQTCYSQLDKLRKHVEQNMDLCVKYISLTPLDFNTVNRFLMDCLWKTLSTSLKWNVDGEIFKLLTSQMESNKVVF